MTNLLSFGPEGTELKLEPLNVLIGPNGSGKSNLVEAIALLRATPAPASPSATGDLRNIVRRGGGVTEWVWKGNPDQPASIEATVENIEGNKPLRHTLTLREHKQTLKLEDERVENAHPWPGSLVPSFFYKFRGGNPVLSLGGKKRPLARGSFDPNASILSQRRDPEAYPELAHLAARYDEIRVYREWSFGRNSAFRVPQQADMRSEPLQEDFSNLGLFLNHLRSKPKAKNAIITKLRDLYQGLDDFDVQVKGGSVDVFLTEGDFVVPAKRLSDGTMRYLCLLAILCDPEPPPLICIEEPELGLHPDLLPKIADLLAEASERTQLIVTTHSDILVDAMTERPEAVIVFEKHDSRTQARRLEATKLEAWLKDYRLGQLWTRGEIGGVRW
jgi:predicted ATPase